MDFNLNGGDTNTYDVIIIGGGPAGASTAIYTARADLRTLVIDKGLTAGALGITSKISNYPGVLGPVSGAELAETMREQAASFGTEFLTDKVVGIHGDGEMKTVIAGTGTFQARAVVLATGSMGRTNAVQGEEDLLGRGVSYCATCDGAFFRDRAVAVVGNNDEALEETLFLTKFADPIHLIVPTPSFKAGEDLIEAVQAHPTIDVRMGTRLRAIEGEQSVEAVRIKPRGGDEEVIPVEGAFVYLQGNKPITDYFEGLVPLTDEGCVVVDEHMETPVPGIYAIGDLLCTHIKQAVIAAADGVIAAIAIDKALHERTSTRVDWS